jgi:23S rRNA (guanosine2251-2'-O)-methyltransferase
MDDFRIGARGLRIVRMRSIVVIAHNLRSTHNVGSLLRTCEGLGVDKVYLTGYSPYPAVPSDTRLPHIVRKINASIHKTALGAEISQDSEHVENVRQVIDSLKTAGYEICALEQTPRAIGLPSYVPAHKVALILGRETEGIEPEVLKLAETIVEIPMKGQKESFNVVQAAAMALYHLVYVS